MDEEALQKHKKLKKMVASLTAVSFLLAFNYFILKALKETLLVTSPEAGAEAIPFVKMWLLFPISVAFLAGFTWMASRISFRAAVTTVISFLLLSYALFTFVLYPIRDSLHLNVLAQELLGILPAGWRGFAAVVRYWSYSLYYVAAECWCTMVYSVVFWGYANAVIRFSDAKKYYPYLTLAGTVSALIAGPLTIFLTGERFGKLLPAGYDQWEAAFYGLNAVVLLCGAVALAVFLKNCPSVRPEKPKAEAPPFWTAFAKTFRSRYLIAIAAACLTYNMLINLTDVVWKNEVLKLHPDPAGFTSYLSYVTVLTGLVSTCITLFVSRQSLKHWGWTKTALITPLVALLTGTLFFGSILGREFGLASVTLSTAALFGSVHICLSSGAKYTLFEPTKEMAFIPLSPEDKLHGKAAIDGIGQRLGKTGSSITYQLLLVMLPTISACTPVVAFILVAACAVCLKAILYIGRQIESPLKA